jgi:hypothetical protein
VEISLKISRILHAGYVFEYKGTQIAFDPIFENPFSRNCYAFPSVRFDHEQIKGLQFSAVFISHYHDDHCSLQSLSLLDRRTPIYIYCLFEELSSWIRELGFTDVHSLKLDTSVVIDSLEVIPRRALDADVDSIFQIKAGRLNVLNVVDSWIDDSTLKQLVKCGPWDLVLWPFQTMLEVEVLVPSRLSSASRELPPEWIPQLKALNPRYVVPSSCQFIHESWSWYNQALFPITYAQFKKEILAALPKSQVVRMNPSVAVELTSKTLRTSSALSWVIPQGNQDVDYEFSAEVRPPPTTEIARHFAPLTAEQVMRVQSYCCADLIQKYKTLGAPEDIYFSKQRIWKLSLYDYKGEVMDYYYQIEGSKIELSFPIKGPLGWTTEVSVAKLYAALEDGEALTSMYLRINHLDLDAEFESELKSVDPLEDPLVRCLFNGVFGAYQRNQLYKLLESQSGPDW